MVVSRFPSRTDVPAFLKELRRMRGSEKHLPFASVSGDQYRLFFDTVAYAEYHALDGRDVIPHRLVVSKPHHLPPFHAGVPVHLDDPILDLLPR